MRLMSELQLAALSQASRTKLISEIVSVLRQTNVPPEAMQAGLTLVGWLARRMPHDDIDGRTLR